MTVGAIAPELDVAFVRALLRDSDQPRCSELEEGKPGKFTNDDGAGCDGPAGAKAKDQIDAVPEAKVRFRTNATPREFIEARNATTRPGFLSPLTEAELEGKTLVLSADGKVGYMLAPDGYAGNLFNNGGPKGAGRAAMIDAIGRGAKYLDCFDGFLPDLYYDYGFVETGRLKFVDEYAPTGWDFVANALLHYVIPGARAQRLAVSRLRHRIEAVPEQLSAVTASRDGSGLAGFRSMDDPDFNNLHVRIERRGTPSAQES